MKISYDISTSDILHSENINIKDCRTEDMIAYFFTKPLQGSLFRRMRNIIMGHAPFPNKERVGTYVNVKTVGEHT